jgi:hypothetical protein
MKTFKQELNKWLENRDTETIEENVKTFIGELKDKINEIESIERYTINGAYDTGYHDKLNNRGMRSNYYSSTYALDDQLKKIMIGINGNQ